MAVPVGTFYINWWHESKTKLGIYFNDFGLGAENRTLLSSLGLDASNGMSCSVSEQYTIRNMITSHPIESGRYISDHIISLPDSINVTGVITSLKQYTIIPALGPVSLSFAQLGDAVRTLISMSKNKIGLTLTTGMFYGSALRSARYLRVNNLVIETLDLYRDNARGKSSIKFTIGFKQMIIASRNGTLQASSFSQATAADGVVL